jgi:hypothetical protein
MFDETKERPSANDSLKDSSVHIKAQAESEETLEHTWHEPGGGGHDVGFVQALADWIIKHRANWRDSRQPESQPDRISTS